MGNYTHLSMTERRRLSTFLEMKLTISEIAKKLDRNRATIYREINRNKELEIYLPGAAQEKAGERAKQKRLGKLQKDGVLRDYVVRSLKKGWSPEQISGRMKCHNLTFYVCHETIYQYIYKSKHEKFYYYLHYKKPKRRKRHTRKQQRCRYGEIRLITQRPQDISTRKRFGHWERDTIHFKGAREKVVTTLVERKSRMVCLIKNNSKHSRGVMDKIKGKFEKLPRKMHKTITFDKALSLLITNTLSNRFNARCITVKPIRLGKKEVMKI